MEAPNGEPIILIEYFNKIPHGVYSTYTSYDFEMNKNGWLMSYKSGMGDNSNIEIGNYCDPECWKVWVHSDYIEKINVRQSEVETLKKPLRISTSYSNYPKSSINPFLVSDEVQEII